MLQSALWPHQNITKRSVARLLQPEILVRIGGLLDKPRKASEVSSSIS